MENVKDYPPYLDCPKPRKIQTNADRIRAMSDEELAVSFGGWVFCGGCPIRQECVCDMPCEDALLNWLQQPVEDD